MLGQNTDWNEVFTGGAIAFGIGGKMGAAVELAQFLPNESKAEVLKQLREETKTNPSLSNIDFKPVFTYIFSACCRICNLINKAKSCGIDNNTFRQYPMTFIVVVICKTLQHVIGCLLVWMVFAAAISKR